MNREVLGVKRHKGISQKREVELTLSLLSQLTPTLRKGRSAKISELEKRRFERLVEKTSSL